MRKKFMNWLCVTTLVVAGAMSSVSCSDSETTSGEGGTVAPDSVAKTEIPTPINWSEDEAKGGDRGVTIKITDKTPTDFKFECIPGKEVKSYRMDVYPVARLYNYLYESGINGKGVEKIDTTAVNELIRKAIFTAGSGGYIFSESTMGANFADNEFDWGNSIYNQAQLLPGAEYVVIAVGCSDTEGEQQADMTICHFKMPSEDLIGDPKVEIQTNVGYQSVAIHYEPNADCKYLYQFCADEDQIDAYQKAYGIDMYKTLLRTLTTAPIDPTANDGSNLDFSVNFGLNADATKLYKISALGLDENKTPGEFTEESFHLKAVPADAKAAECSITAEESAASAAKIKISMENSCHTIFYYLMPKSEYDGYKDNMDGLRDVLANGGLGMHNANFDKGQAYTTTEVEWGLQPNTDYVIAYIGRNQYMQLTDVKASEFKTKAFSSNGSASMTLTETGSTRSAISLHFAYSGNPATVYWQYIMDPSLLEKGNEEDLKQYLLGVDANMINYWAVNGAESEDNTITGMDPGTKYYFAYMVEDWKGALSPVKVLEANTKAIQAGEDPTMTISGFLNDKKNNFIASYQIVKDVASYKYCMYDMPSTTGETLASYKQKLKDLCIEIGMTSSDGMQQDYGSLPDKDIVAMCVPYGANDKIGDVYAVFYKGGKILTLDDLFPGASAAAKKSRSIANARKGRPAIRKAAHADKRTKASQFRGVKGVQTSTNAKGQKVRTYYMDLIELGKSPK